MQGFTQVSLNVKWRFNWGAKYGQCFYIAAPIRPRNARVELWEKFMSCRVALAFLSYLEPAETAVGDLLRGVSLQIICLRLETKKTPQKLLCFIVRVLFFACMHVFVSRRHGDNGSGLKRRERTRWSGQSPKSATRKIGTIDNMKYRVDLIFLTVSPTYQHPSPVHSSYLILLPNDGFYHPQPDTFYVPPALYFLSPGLLSALLRWISSRVECLATRVISLLLIFFLPGTLWRNSRM